MTLPTRAGAECAQGISPVLCERRTGLVGKHSLTYGVGPGFESAFSHTVWFSRIPYILEKPFKKITNKLSEMDQVPARPLCRLSYDRL